MIFLMMLEQFLEGKEQQRPDPPVGLLRKTYVFMLGFAVWAGTIALVELVSKGHLEGSAALAIVAGTIFFGFKFIIVGVLIIWILLP